jgi:2'-5' RNA ligase
MKYLRYAIFYTPPRGQFADFGARWLGWDIANGLGAEPLGIDGLPAPWEQIIEAPRPYGFHATIKPPFRLAGGKTQGDLSRAVDRLARQLGAVPLAGLDIVSLGRFLALVPVGDASAITGLAASVVKDLDTFRAPADAQETKRRSHPNLTLAQKDNLEKWGYPHVMDQFRFHMTLTGKLSKSDAAATKAALGPLLSSVIPDPLVIDALTLVAQEETGLFHALQRFPLAG